MNIHIDGVPINQSNQSKSLWLIIDENLSWKAHIHEISWNVSSGIGALEQVRPLNLFQCTLQLLKYTKVLSSHTSIITALYGMAWPNSLVRNFKIVLSELSPNLAMILVPDFFLTRLVGTIYRLEGLNKRLNRPFARWRHFTTTIRILFIFPFIFKFCNPSEVWITKALICTRKQNHEGFWS